MSGGSTCLEGVTPDLFREMGVEMRHEPRSCRGCAIFSNPQEGLEAVGHVMSGNVLGEDWDRIQIIGSCGNNNLISFIESIGFMHGRILMHNAYTSFFLFFWDTLKNPFWGTIKQFNSIQILLYPTNNQLLYPTGKKLWDVSYSIRITPCIISK